MKEINAEDNAQQNTIIQLSITILKICVTLVMQAAMYVQAILHHAHNAILISFSIKNNVGQLAHNNTSLIKSLGNVYFAHNTVLN